MADKDKDTLHRHLLAPLAPRPAVSLHGVASRGPTIRAPVIRDVGSALVVMDALKLAVDVAAVAAQFEVLGVVAAVGGNLPLAHDGRAGWGDGYGWVGVSVGEGG
ncbi:hypothetical protein MMC24_005353 [Lignoscripta atroalba]|nr:hypothetical protein [Lignoscripta atroalba]